MQNMYTRQIVLPYNTAQQVVDLTQGRFIHWLRFRITGALTVVGAAPGTLNDTPVVRLIRQIRIVHDDQEIVMPMPLVPFHYLYPRSKLGPIADTNPASAAAQVGTALAATVLVPFSPEWLANPYDMSYIARKVNQQFRLYVDWETGVAVAGDSPGSAALITGGGNASTLIGVQVTITECSSVATKRLPVLYPRWRYFQSDQWTAANPTLPVRLLTGDRVAAHLIMEREGALNPPSPPAVLEQINNITLRAGSVRKLDNVAYRDLKLDDLERFPGIPAAELDCVQLTFADHGKLQTILDPPALGTDPRYEFNVAVPVVAPAVLCILELATWGKDGETQLPR